MSTISLCLHI